jgi:hypothetical protein
MGVKNVGSRADDATRNLGTLTTDTPTFALRQAAPDAELFAVLQCELEAIVLDFAAPADLLRLPGGRTALGEEEIGVNAKAVRVIVPVLLRLDRCGADCDARCRNELHVRDFLCGSENRLGCRTFFKYHCLLHLTNRGCLTPSQQPCNYTNVILPEPSSLPQVRVWIIRAERAKSSRSTRAIRFLKAASSRPSSQLARRALRAMARLPSMKSTST